MGWILGYWGQKATVEMRERLATLHPAPLHTAVSDRYVAVAGGIPETCLHGELASGRGDWLVVGAALHREQTRCTLLDANAWNRRLQEERPSLAGLDGHFLAVRLKPGGFECAVDTLGLRTCYLAEWAGGLLFSTRADWLSRLMGGLAPDLHEFGPHWLGFNQLSYGSFVRGLKRVGPGGVARFDGQRLKVTTSPWTPGAEPSPPEEVEETLAALAQPVVGSGLLPSVGLSGGLDSRVVLALNRGNPDLAAHVFGATGHPDVATSRRIADGEGIPQAHFHAPVPDTDTCLAMGRDFAAQTLASYPLSAVLGLRYYPELRERGRFIIDGGFGEIGRRQFMNRLRLLGRKAMRNGDPDALMPYLQFTRAEILAPEAERAMRAGFRDQVADMPGQRCHASKDLGAGSVLDLLSVRTRLPNYYGPEQARLDGVNVCLMPMAQPSFLDAVLRLPERHRQGARLYRSLIRKRWPSLARYPLVKGTQTYPFPLTPLPAHLWTKATTRLRTPYADPTRHEFLDRLRGFVLDTAASSETRGCGLYDVEKLSVLAQSYYAGRRQLGAALDWWLSLELR